MLALALAAEAEEEDRYEAAERFIKAASASATHLHRTPRCPRRSGAQSRRSPRPAKPTKR